MLFTTSTHRRLLAGIVVLLLALPAWPAPKVVTRGEPASTAFGKTQDDKLLLPREYAGKVVLAMYYTSWCGYCRKAIPDFVQFQQAVEAHGLQVVLVNHKEDRKIFREYARHFQKTTVAMGHDRTGEFGDAYGVESYPHIIVVDRAGKLRAVDRGYGESSREYYIQLLTKLLNEGEESNRQEPASAGENSVKQDGRVATKSAQSTLIINRDEELEKPEASTIIDAQQMRFENPFVEPPKK